MNGRLLPFVSMALILVLVLTGAGFYMAFIHTGFRAYLVFTHYWFYLNLIRFYLLKVLLRPSHFGFLSFFKREKNSFFI